MIEWFEVTAKYMREDEKGLLKRISEQYLLDSVSFTDAEAIITGFLSESVRGDFRIESIKRSKINDVFTYEDGENFFHKCKVVFMSADSDTGKDKKITHYMLVEAKDVTQAHERINEKMKETLSVFQVPDVIESKIVEVIFHKDKVA